ncbi:hypothetical protein BU16DRAFT_456471 [Lophium mytilinum]|uniref:Ubiquitin-like domain-containing protein n=1 Tax=Lophium mytilinum TaxID=390894 RepID=A0A6A6R0R6_9PEZI|nr:hypothetical protein BU16DRAFT_456471 [Lophium mytilinum]
MTTPLPDQILYLIIRFTASIPDLPLSISSPRTLTTLSLKRLIRTHLPPAHASSRLRLIYAGKVLADTAPLSLSLRLPPPPPPRSTAYNDSSQSKGKGKEPVRDLPPDNSPRLYIHCSLGDALSPGDLAAEASSALTSETSLAKQLSKTTKHSASGSTSSATGGGRRDSAATTAAPQGFDRLLSTGFTSTEIASLRSQFLTNISFTHTPDNMPSGAALRALEDSWLDSSAHEAPAGDATAAAATATEGEAGWGAGFGVDDGGLDDMLFGYLTGFFWPLAAGVWGMREEGVWTRRRQVAVVMGVVLNCAFGFLRWSS